MIISHKNEFIFVHCRKCAGSSITSYLNKALGPDDIQVGAWGDTIRSGGKYNKRAFKDAFNGINQIRSRLRMRDFSTNPETMNEAIKQKYKKILKLNSWEHPVHPPAKKIKTSFPNEWEKYFKFCVVRNPYDHAISDYFWRVKSRSKNMTFEEFLEVLGDPNALDPEHVRPPTITNWPLYTIDNIVEMDFILKYETLSYDIKKLFDQLGFEISNENLPRHKSGHRKEEATIDSFYTERTKRMVEKIYKVEFEYFKYDKLP